MTVPITLWPKLQAMADAACRHFDLRMAEMRPMTNQRKKKYGECSARGVIEIRVHVYQRPRRALAQSTIFDTLAHELAHLREWDHGKAHQALQREILEFWREGKN